MGQDVKSALKTLNIKKIYFPTLCGLVITACLFYKSGKISSEAIVLLAKPKWNYLSMALFAVVLREFGHICRLRILSNSILSWAGCFYVAILVEFASAVTPSVVGGGIVAVFLLSKEGFSLGRSLSYVVVNGIMDNFFFLVSGAPGFVGAYQAFFAMTGKLSYSAKAIFFTNYIVLFLYTLIIAVGVFINPNLLKWMLVRVTSIGFLKRWRHVAYKLSQDIITTSNEFRGRSALFWLKMLLCTVFTWIVRYAFLNCVIASYYSVTCCEHIVIFCKQLIMWALMLVPVSPGGSGVAEFLFQKFFEPMLGKDTLLIAVLWRSCTFYLYLILGGIFLPKWLHRIFRNKIS